MGCHAKRILALAGLWRPVSMTAFKHPMTCLAKVPSMPIGRDCVAGGEEGPPPLTIGMIVPLFWNGCATRCAARR